MVTINIALKFLPSGSYVIIYIYANETFPTEGRNTGMGACSMVARVGAMIGTFSNDHLVNISFKYLINVLMILLFRLERGNIFQLLFMLLLQSLRCYLQRFFQKHLENHYHKQLKMSKKWVLLGKFDKKIYRIIKILFLSSSFGRPARTRNGHVNGKYKNSEDLALEKNLKEDVDF